MIRKEEIQTVVINPTPNTIPEEELIFMDEPAFTGSSTTGMIASVTNGVHYDMHMGPKNRERVVTEISGILLQAQERFSLRHMLSLKRKTN
jgi:hypothetical protein